VKQTLKRILHPVRKLAARFVTVEEPYYGDTIIYKAANIIAAEKVEGDYLEFGVFNGSSFIQAHRIIKAVFEQKQKLHAGRTEEDAVEIRRIWDEMRFFAFDSFQGLPEPHAFDKESGDFAKGKYTCTERSFRENLVTQGVPLGKVVTIAGWFEETCTEETIRKYAMKKASIIHVDCDFYASARKALEFVKPLLTDGTIIVFDDWYCFRGNPNLGEQRAFNEWKATMTGWIFTEYQKEGAWRNSFIASKRNVPYRTRFPWTAASTRMRAPQTKEVGHAHRVASQWQRT
jgi:O-methyltransferase